MMNCYSWRAGEKMIAIISKDPKRWFEGGFWFEYQILFRKVL